MPKTKFGDEVDIGDAKHWWEVPALREAYDVRVDGLRVEMRERFKELARTRGTKNAANK